MAAPDIPGGYQPDTRSEPARRADYDLLRRVAQLERQIADIALRVEALETPTP